MDILCGWCAPPVHARTCHHLLENGPSPDVMWQCHHSSSHEKAGESMTGCFRYRQCCTPCIGPAWTLACMHYTMHVACQAQNKKQLSQLVVGLPTVNG